MKPLSALLLSLGCVLLFTACRGQTPVIPDLPTGIQTMTGTLVPAEISTLRRGSHLLTIQGRRVFFVESTTVNLRSFEGKLVVIRGVLEPNSDPAILPVLVTQDVKAVEQDLTPLSLPAFGLSGNVPRSWIMAKQKDATVLLLEGTATPLVTIEQKKQTPLPSSGAPFFISGHHATRQTNPDSQKEITSIAWEDGLVVLTFAPPAETTPEDAGLLRAQWGGFLTSLSFSGAASGTQSTSSTSETADGTPCGGTAGILCPEGQYCAITDMQQNIGHCKKI